MSESNLSEVAILARMDSLVCELAKLAKQLPNQSTNEAESGMPHLHNDIHRLHGRLNQVCDWRKRDQFSAARRDGLRAMVMYVPRAAVRDAS